MSEETKIITAYQMVDMDYRTIDDVIEDLTEYKQLFGGEAILVVGDGDVEIEYKRPETHAERDHRLEQEKRTTAYQMKQYLELKKKFGDIS